MGDRRALFPESLLAQSGIGALHFTLNAQLLRASPLALRLLALPDGAALSDSGSAQKEALAACVREAARQRGSVATTILFSATGEPLEVTAQRVRERKGPDRVTCLLRRAPGRPVASRDFHLLEAMVEGAQDGLWILAGTGEVLNVNRAAEQLTGLQKSAVIGRNVGELAGDSPFDSFIVAEVVSKRTPVSLIQTLPAGRKVLVSGKPILSPDSDVQYVVLTLRDVTELNRLMGSLQESRKLSDHYRRELRVMETRDAQADWIVARSDAMQKVWSLALKYASVDSPVLLLGETGSGKGVFSKIIHQASARAAGPFMELNCGAIPEGLIEAELFGYARGAFTGADSRGKIGLVELAHSGTLLLNEIGDLPLPLQVKLLRFLEDGEIWPVGAVKGRRPDVRILAATNQDLAALMAGGAFRRDLFYRLNVLRLEIPSLRERRQDIPWLVNMILSQLEKKLQRGMRLTPEALGLISQYDFPGNVRELWNIVERLVVTANGDLIDVSDLPPEVSQPRGGGVQTDEERDGSWRRAVSGVEAAIFADALSRYGTQVLAAKHLGVSQSTISRRAKLFGLKRAASP